MSWKRKHSGRSSPMLVENWSLRPVDRRCFTLNLKSNSELISRYFRQKNIFVWELSNLRVERKHLAHLVHPLRFEKNNLIVQRYVSQRSCVINDGTPYRNDRSTDYTKLLYCLWVVDSSHAFILISKRSSDFILELATAYIDFISVVPW